MAQVTAYTNEGRYKCLEDLPIDSVELSLGYCGWERCYPGHRFGPNKRTYYVLHIVANGKGKLEKNGEVFHLTTGKKSNAVCGIFKRKISSKFKMYSTFKIVCG